MDKKSRALLGDVQKKTMKLQKCNQKSCKAELSASLEQKEEVAIKMKKLSADMAEKKLKPEQYFGILNKIKADLMKSKITRDMLECSIKKCDSKVREALKAFSNIIEHDCKKNNNKISCTNLAAIKTILAKKKITVKDYLKILSFIS